MEWNHNDFKNDFKFRVGGVCVLRVPKEFHPLESMGTGDWNKQTNDFITFHIRTLLQLNSQPHIILLKLYITHVSKNYVKVRL